MLRQLQPRLARAKKALLCRLDIAIAGGGIGGLAAALALHRTRGCNVQLFEQAAAFEPLGAGLQLGPNAVRILQDWDLGPALARVAAFPERLEVRSAISGQCLAMLPLGDAVLLRHGAAHATVHRADLHALLLQALTGNGESGASSDPDNKSGSVQIHLGTALHSLAQDAGSVQLGFQSTARASAEVPQPIFHRQADALIGADGLWSMVRRQLLPGGPPQSTGHQAFRALLPQAALPASLRSHNAITAWLGPGLHAVGYPVRGGDWFNMVVIVQNQVLRKQLGNLISLELEEAAASAMAPAEAVAAALASTHCCTMLQDKVTAVGALSSTGWQRWPLFDRPPMRSADEQVRGRIALLGDAAHPMRPYLAQGTAMAIEDAAELAQWLAPVSSSSNAADRVPALLQIYAKQRWQRNAQVQARSRRNGHIFHASGVVRWGRNAALRLLGARILDLPWLYSYGRQPRQRFSGER